MCWYFLCALPWRGQMRPAAPFFGSGGDKAHFDRVLHTLVLHGFCTGDLSHVYHGIKQSTRGSKRMRSFNWLFWYSFWTWVLPILSHPLCWFTREVAYAAWGESALRASRSWLAQPQALRRWRCRWSSQSHLEGIEVAISSASSRRMQILHTTLKKPVESKIRKTIMHYRSWKINVRLFLWHSFNAHRPTLVLFLFALHVQQWNSFELSTNQMKKRRNYFEGLLEDKARGAQPSILGQWN